MDFIPFNSPANGQQNCSPHVLKQNKTLSNGKTPNTKGKSSSKPAFGSPASFPPFGSPALSFGSPAVSNTSFSPLTRQTSPRNFHQSTPRPYIPRNGSPRHQHTSSYQNTPPQFANRPYSNGQIYKDNSDFKTPHQCFSPRGRGNGRKSFTRQFNQTPRLDPNCNIGGSTNIEDYYNPSMVEDPWRNMAPVIVSQTSKF